MQKYVQLTIQQIQLGQKKKNFPDGPQQESLELLAIMDIMNIQIGFLV